MFFSPRRHARELLAECNDNMEKGCNARGSGLNILQDTYNVNCVQAWVINKVRVDAHYLCGGKWLYIQIQPQGKYSPEIVGVLSIHPINLFNA